MRRIYAKRAYSRRVLLPFERQVYDRIPIKQSVTVQRRNIHRQIVSKAVMMTNPYFTQLLKDRYQIYQDALKKKMTVREYEDAVKKWYAFYGYSDSSGMESPWTALREYHRDWKLKHPNDEWHSPEYKDKKSHHGSGTWSKENERKKKMEWRKTPAGQKSIERAKQKAKLARMNRVS